MKNYAPTVGKSSPKSLIEQLEKRVLMSNTTLAYSMLNTLTSAVSGKTPGIATQAVVDPTPGNGVYTENPNLFVKGSGTVVPDFTCISEGSNATVLSPSCILEAEHYQPQTNPDFTDASNHHYELGDYFNINETVQVSDTNSATDLALVFLSKPLPSSIVPAEVLPSNYRTYLNPSIASPVPILRTDQGFPDNNTNKSKMFMTSDWTETNPVTENLTPSEHIQNAYMGSFSPSGESALAPWSIDPANNEAGGPYNRPVLYDSGSGVFTIINGQTVCLGCLATNGAFSAISEHADLINSLIQEYAPSGEGLHTIDLDHSGYDTLPTVQTPAAAPSSTVAGPSTTLSVLGTKDGSNSGLTYTWSETGGPLGVSFTGNANNTAAASNITAVFPQSGLYTLTATIADAYGGTVSSSTTVFVTPSWLSSTRSASTYNFSTHTLTVTGQIAIIADPGAAAPIITASGTAKVVITPALSDTDVHIGGITLTGSADIDVTSVGLARSHSDHNVLVVGPLNATSDPTFSIASTAKLNLEDNDMIVHTGTSDSTGHTELGIVQAAAAEGRNVAPGGVYDGTWTGNGLTSSAAAYVDSQAQAGYEQNILAVELNSEMYLGGYSSTGWVVGSATEAVGTNDILVKYTYNGDLNLEGKVSDNAATIFDTFYDDGATTNNDFAFGDLNGDGKIDGNDATIFGTVYGNGTSGSGLPQL